MKKHILLIDDDKDELRLFVHALDDLNIRYKCTWAQSGEQALQQLRYLAPDIIFLDVNMPGKNGFEVLNDIKRMPEKKEIPVILFSTTMDHHINNMGLAFGATACIQKSNNVKSLSKVLDKFVTTEHVNLQ